MTAAVEERCFSAVGRAAQCDGHKAVISRTVIALSASLGIPLSQVMVIGDNDNDLPMMRCAGYAVAMGNATPAVMDCANYVTLPCEEHGVARAIRVLALGEQLDGVCKR